MTKNGVAPMEDLGSPMQYDPDFRGPAKGRSCTDVICLFIFMVFVGCWIAVGLYAFTNGDPNTLLVPKDSTGARCGLDNHVSDKPYLFFFDLTKCLSPSVPFTGCPTQQVCVENCPNKYFFWDGSNSVQDLICTKPVSSAEANQAVADGVCAKWYLPSSPFEKRCIPILNQTLFEQITEQTNTTVANIIASIKNLKILSQAEQVGQNIVDDLVNSWWMILIGVGFAVITCIIYIMILRWLAAFMTWLSMIGVVALLALAVYFSAKKYIEYKNNPLDEDQVSGLLEAYLTKKDTWLAFLIISSILLGLILIILIFLRSRIVLAIALVKEGSKAVGSVTSVLFFPIFPWILQLGVIAFAICVGLYLTTTGTPLYKIRDMEDDCVCAGNTSHYKNGVECIPSDFLANCQNRPHCINAKCKFISIQNTQLYPYLQTFNVFAFFWSVFFVSALGQMILAMVFATWYWTFKKSKLPFFAVTGATLSVFRYHLGTLAFGSLLIAICRMIRVVLEYIDRKLKKYDNEVTKAITCCMKCFFWCLEKFLKFLNRNAYIMCAIHGKNFCMSAKDAFMLLMRNILRVFVLDKVTDFLFFLGKILITVGVGSVAYVVFVTDLTNVDHSGLNYELVPVVTIMICTFLVSSVFFSVYSMAVDTLFMCFLEDCERNDGSAEKPYFMSKNLMKIFGKKNKLQ